MFLMLSTRFHSIPVDVEMYPGERTAHEIKDGLILHGELTGYFTEFRGEPDSITCPKLKVMGADKRWVEIDFDDLSDRAQDQLIRQIRKHFADVACAA